jgi:5-methylthioribose kinase
MPGNQVERVSSVDAPLDVETMTDTIDMVLSMQLSTSTRADIDGRTGRAVGFLNLLLAESVDQEDEDTAAIVRQAHRFLELSGRPTERTPVFEAFRFMVDTAKLSKALLSAYAQRNGIDLRR